MKLLILGAALLWTSTGSIQAAPPSLTGYILIDVDEYACVAGGPTVTMRSYAHPGGKLVQRRWSLAEREFVVLLAAQIAGLTVQRAWASWRGDGRWERQEQVSICEVAEGVEPVEVM